MSSTRQTFTLAHRPITGLLSFLLTMAFSGTAQAIDIADEPLFSSSGIPGNLALVASLEFPTMVSVAHINNAYSSSNIYIGYFDPAKCYGYSYSATESERHFYPVNTSGPTCSGLWSGNYLNWAATQTIDPFRKALTGGYRMKDDTKTWLEKAWQDGQGSMTNFPNRTISGSATVVPGATPFSWSSFKTRILGLGNQMYFTNTGNLGNKTNPTASTAVSPTPVIAYDPSAGSWDGANIYAVSVRVKVCDNTVGLESNCVPYGSHWKPEGLIQERAKDIRYSGFGYLGDGRRYDAGTDASTTRGGGVMRARMKFVGPTMISNGVEVANPNGEWYPDTGIFIKNPDPDDATATQTATGQTVTHSGVINFLNKTGQIVPDALYKRYDPVSELYYTGIRYFKNLGNVSEYSAVSGDAAKQGQLVDGLPVITNWTDPIQHWCQKNVILGIGDTNTQRDKNIYGGTSNSAGEPVMPGSVSADTSVNVATATSKVAALEGITISNTDFSGGNNSAFIAGLAYDSKTKDIRTDLAGKQTISTYWVDIQEFQVLKAKNQNQYWLAAKYGGLKVPDDFDTYSFAGPVPLEWWHTNSDTLSTGDLRPDNFYTVANPDQMVAGLQSAFAQIAVELSSSSSSAAASSAVLQTDTLLYTAGFRNRDWSGTLTGREIDSDGNLGEATAADGGWDAEALLAARTPDSRNIVTRAAEAIGSGAGGGVLFQWNNLHDNQKAALNHAPDNSEDNLGSIRLAWLRGTEHASLRSRLQAGQLRLLGDIINSDPQYRDDILYMGANDGMLHAFDAITGEELFAYIPSPLLLPEEVDADPDQPDPPLLYARLSRLMAPNYTHRYFMDGKVTVADVTIGGSAKTVLVGSMGAGGRTVFALDVSNPASFSASNVLWEFTHAELGYNVGQPAVVRMSNGTWAAVFGNGYNSNSGKAALFIVNLETGALMNNFIGTNEDTSNGLASPFVTDWPEMNLRANRIYAGDLLGNLWAFDVSNANPNVWTVASNRRVLFAAKDPDNNPQPITSRPFGAQIHNTDKAMIVFGTGSYFRGLPTVPQDKTDTQIQSLYGIIDQPTIDPDREVDRDDDLLEQEIIAQTTFQGQTVRILSDYTIDPDDEGWFIDLDQERGERVISGPETLGSTEQRVRFTTLIPDQDPCGTGRGGFLMDIDLLTGGRTSFPVFDLNGDGFFNEQDQTKITIDSQLVLVPVSGLGFGSGEKIAVINVPEPTPICDGEDCQDPDPYQLVCDGQGNCERARPSGEASGRQSWRQLR